MARFYTPGQLRQHQQKRRPLQQTRPTQVVKPGEICKVKILDDLNDGGEVYAVKVWGDDDNEDPEEKKFKVYAWGFGGGTLDENKKGFCVYWNRKWWLIAPEECPS